MYIRNPGHMTKMATTPIYSKVSVTPGERTSNGLSPLVSVGIRSLSGEPVPCPLMSVFPVGVR